MKTTRRNAVLCVLWLVFVLSIPIYVFWAIFNYEHLNSWTEKKFCGFLRKVIIQKQWTKKSKTNQTPTGKERV